MATHILGMAKSNLDLKGAKNQKTELDLLRLIYAVERMMKRGESAKGYLLVANELVCKRAGLWLEKYETDVIDQIEILNFEEMFPALYDKSKQGLIEEKNRNAIANTLHVDKKVNGDGAIAKKGKKLFEAALREYLVDHYQIENVKSENMPLGINWDFYHIVD